jgi:NAD(P)-dependent dehydrogenase (short-subunit alcohol dehydrogenase family)
VRVALIGSTGTIGGAVLKALQARHEVIAIGNRGGESQADLASPPSIRSLYAAIGMLDAVVCTAGHAKFGPLSQLTDSDFEVCIHDKLMGQVDLVRYGIEHVLDNGSFTLTAGTLARHPMPGSAATSLVNGALEAFTRAAALEMPRGIRINVVSPAWVSETLTALGHQASEGVPAEQVALDYVASVEGSESGRVFGPE